MPKMIVRIPKKDKDFNQDMVETIDLEDAIVDANELSSAVIQLLNAMLMEQSKGL